METCAIIIVEVNAMENGYTLIFETWTFKWRLRNTIIKRVLNKLLLFKLSSWLLQYFIYPC